MKKRRIAPSERMEQELMDGLVSDKQAERIKKAEELREDDRAMLLAHVARTPYMQVA